MRGQVFRSQIRVWQPLVHAAEQTLLHDLPRISSQGVTDSRCRKAPHAQRLVMRMLRDADPLLLSIRCAYVQRDASDEVPRSRPSRPLALSSRQAAATTRGGRYDDVLTRGVPG